MKVKDIIEVLQKLDPDMDTEYEYYAYMTSPIASVFERRGKVVFRNVTGKEIKNHKGLWR